MKFTLLLVLILPQAMARVMYSTGTFVPYYNQMQVSDSGAKQSFDINPYLGIGTVYNISGKHFFTPEFGYSFFLDNAKKTKKDVIFLHYNFATAFTSEHILRYGLTTHWYRISGDGGDVRLKNGNSYSNFKAPSKTVTTYFTTLDIGYEFFFKSDMTLRFDLNMMSAAELENKSFNYLLTLNFYR